MKTVLLTSGPRGSGKSKYINEISRDCPELAVVSRDEILISLFGSTCLSPYEGGHHYAHNVMFGKVRECLSENHPAELILLDCWNGYSGQRRSMISKLREMGAEKVICLYFSITEDLCVELFKLKADVGGSLSENSIRSDHELYYHHARDIQDDGFDEIIIINSNQLRFAFTFK